MRSREHGNGSFPTFTFLLLIFPAYFCACAACAACVWGMRW
ncbi:exported protein of unknown function [Sterolibacterium denitrificans]|uniref:Uncharacterized protein n=1 Tax=Sterolibacterium denitrificans TaxID=157592 RepID=A0A7Z7MW14_9PROT|nr:exported protein of unknown function [Sterolibacterium denitrificans]